jgi:hypothetical protein
LGRVLPLSAAKAGARNLRSLIAVAPWKRMKIYYEKLSDLQRYLDNNKDIGLDEKKPLYSSIMRTVRRF